MWKEIKRWLSGPTPEEQERVYLRLQINTYLRCLDDQPDNSSADYWYREYLTCCERLKELEGK